MIEKLMTKKSKTVLVGAAKKAQKPTRTPSAKICSVYLLLADRPHTVGMHRSVHFTPKGVNRKANELANVFLAENGLPMLTPDASREMREMALDSLNYGTGKETDYSVLFYEVPASE